MKNLLRNVKTVLILMLLLAIPLAVLSAKGVEEKASNNEIQTVVWQNFLSSEKAFAPVINEMVQMFENEHPNIKIEIVELPYEQTLQQTIISATAKNMADIVLITPQWVPPLVKMNALESLDNYFTTAELSDIPKAAYESGVVEGTTYSVPALLNVVMVWAWKPLLEKAGLEPVVPSTWEDFKKASQKISALGNDYYGFAARTNNTSNSAFWMFPVIWGHGGQFADASGNIILNVGDGYAKALDYYAELVKTGQSPNSLGVRELRNLFAQGDVGFLLDVSTAIATFRSVSERGQGIDTDVVVGLVPKSEDGNRYGIGNDNVYAVSAESKVKESAIEFIKFMTTDPRATKLFYKESGAFPTRKSLYNDPEYANEPYFNEIAEMAEFATSNPSENPNFGQALDVMANAMQEVILGGDSQIVSNKTTAAIKDIYNK